MELKRLMEMGAWLVSAVLINIGRVDPTVAFYGALGGLLLLVPYARVRTRSLLVAAILPAMAWIVGLGPWGGIVAAVFMAVPFVILLGSVPVLRWGREAWLMIVFGMMVSALTTLILIRLTAFGSTTDLLALLVAVVSFRIATISLGEDHWVHGAAVASCIAPYLGTPGYLVAAGEVAFSLLMLAVPQERRMAGVIGSLGLLAGLL